MLNPSLSRRAVLGSVAAMAAGLGLSSCSGGGGETGGAPTTITMLVLGDKPTNGRLEAMLTKLNPLLTERTNATLEFFFVEWADWQTQYNVQLLSGDSSIDLIITATDWLFAWENAERGAFLAMDEELLSTNAPKTWEAVQGRGNWELCKLPDGMIYFIPEDNLTQWTNHGFFYRGDWAAAAGLPDGTISRFEQFTQYFTWVKQNQLEAYPWDVAGSNDYPLTGYLQSKTDGQTLQQVSAGNYYPFQTSAADPFTVGSWFMDSDQLVDAARLAQEWNALGVWREDALNYDGDAREALYAGLSGTDQHHTHTFITGVYHNLTEGQAGSDPKIYWFGQENNNIFRDIKTHGAMAVSANSENPEKALQVYDLLRNDEEIYRLVNFGIEGTDYVMTAAGELDQPEGYDPSADALGTNFWGGRMDEFEPVRVTDHPDKQALFSQLDGIAKDYTYSTLLLNKDAIDPSLAAIGSVLSTYIPQLQYGKLPDPAGAIEKMRNELRAAGFEDVRASIQADIDTWASEKGLR